MFKLTVLIFAVTAMTVGASAQKSQRRVEEPAKKGGKTEAERAQRTQEVLQPKSAAKTAAESDAAMRAARARVLGIGVAKSAKDLMVSDTLLGRAQTAPVSEAEIRIKVDSIQAEIKKTFGMETDRTAIRTIVVKNPAVVEKLTEAVKAMGVSLAECGAGCLSAGDQKVQWALAAIINFEAALATKGIPSDIDPKRFSQIIAEVSRLKDGPNGKKEASTAIEVWAEAYNNGIKYLGENAPGNAFERGLADSFRLRGVADPEGRAKRGRECKG